MNAELKNRLKSLAWRVGMMALAAVVAFAIENLGLFGLPVWAVGVAGLVLGEVSKWLNNVNQERAQG